MKSPGIDTSGTARAQQAIADAQKAATELQKNFSADLKTENLTQVTPGGGADMAGISASLGPKRKKSSGLASQLGISV